MKKAITRFNWINLLSPFLQLHSLRESLENRARMAPTALRAGRFASKA